MDAQLLSIIVSVIAFLAVVALVEGIYLLWRESWLEGRSKIRRRIRNLSAGGGHGQKALELLRARQLSGDPGLNRFLAAIPRAHALDRLLEQAGSEVTVIQFFGFQLLYTAVFFLLSWFALGLAWPVALVVGAIAGFGLPVFYLSRKRAKRQEKFVRQLPDTMDFLARGLRAGNPFTAALYAASKEMPAPMAEEFGITFDEINYGLEVEEALYNLEERVGSPDVAYFVTAVLIQRRTGGNLADVLNRIAAMMRERYRTVNEVRIQAAEMRLSANILIALPFVVAGVLALFRPDYMGTLFEHPIGQVIIAIQLILMFVGYQIMRRMVHFRI
ncbi:MAG TPA: type II secretion system F family protein [Gammaproteobacteria bacterium]|nr:type II secretion system F family protein [Gammaproteobacteria bacterium]